MALSSDITNAISSVSKNAISVAPYDKTKDGIIRTINLDNTVTATIDGTDWRNVRVYGLISNLNRGDIVKVIIPQNNDSGAFVISPTIKQAEVVISDETVRAFEEIGYIDN